MLRTGPKISSCASRSRREHDRKSSARQKSPCRMRVPPAAGRRRADCLLFSGFHVRRTVFICDLIHRRAHLHAGIEPVRPPRIFSAFHEHRHEFVGDFFFDHHSARGSAALACGCESAEERDSMANSNPRRTERQGDSCRPSRIGISSFVARPAGIKAGAYLVRSGK